MVHNSNEIYHFLDPRTRADPFPLYKKLREEDPVHWCEELQGWLITRYADCEQVLHEPSMSTGQGLVSMFDRLEPELQARFDPLRRHVCVGMGSLDPPEHTRIRGPMNRSFSARLIRNQVDFIHRVTNELLDELIPRGEFDVVAELAYPLPAIVIANLLGTGREHQHLFLRCSDALGDLWGSTSPSLEVLQAAQDHVKALSDHIESLIESRDRSAPPSDLLGVLIAPEEGAQPLKREEILANCVELLFAGHLTITTMIGTCLYTLLRHPRFFEDIKNRPELAENAIEEILRFDGPIQMVRRLATEDFELGGKRIERGQMVWVLLGAANRDANRYENPEQLDIYRTGIRHLGFGVGVHYCIGSALARLEGEIAINTLIRRLPNIQIAEPALEWHDLPAVRSLKSLRVRFDGG